MASRAERAGQVPPLAPFRCAWDTHVHVFGDHQRYPMTASRRYTPGPATADRLKQHLRMIGARRAVLIQASVYGCDNRCMLDALATFGDDAQAVVALPPGVGAEFLAAHHRLGVRGVRINPVRGIDDLAERLPQIRDLAGGMGMFGWHLELNASPRAALAAVELLGELHVPLVFDHAFGLSPAESDLGELLGTIIDRCARPDVWVKISGLDRIRPQAELGRMKQAVGAIIRAMPDRVVWGSDWPHTPVDDVHHGPVFRDVDDLAAAEGAVRLAGPVARAMLVDNPARLYAKVANHEADVRRGAC